MKPQSNFRRILAAILIVGKTLTSELDAFEVFLSSIKELTLYYRSGSGKSQKAISNNWYVRYQHNTTNQGEGFKTFQSPYQPILSVISTTHEGIYMRHFKEHWLDINPNSEENTFIAPIFEVGTGNEILANAMNDNETLLTVALRNNTLLTIDLSKSQHKKPYIVHKFEIEVKLGGEDSKTTTIGLIPYSNYIVFAPNRFQFYKMDRITGELKYSNRSYLDSMGHLVHPTPTHRPEIDPHNPNKYNDPMVNQRIFKLTELTYLVGTASKTGVNVLIDWVTMKVIKYWSLKDFNPMIEGDESSYIVRSICYFGGTPQVQMYPFLASKVIEKLYLFHGIHRNIVDYIQLPKRSLSGDVRWINNTSYLYILQTVVVSDNKNSFGSYFLNLGQFTQFTPIFLKQKFPASDLRFHQSNLISFDNKIEESHTFYEMYNQTNFLFLFMYSDSSSLHVRTPPFNWDICRDQNLSFDVYMNYYMLYGSYMQCFNLCQGGFEGFSFEDQKRNLLIECRRHTCQDPTQKPHLLYFSNEKGDDYIHENKCYEQYRLKEIEKDLASNNGCHPGFNMDNYGLCRECRSLYEDLSDEGSTDLNHPKNFAVSDCLFFNYFEYDYDSFGVSIFHYKREMYNESLVYKGYQKEKKYFKHLFKDTYTLGLSDKVFDADMAIFDQHLVMKGSKNEDLLKSCYLVTYNYKLKPLYSVKTREGYFMEEIKNDKTGQAISQKGLYEETSPLETFYCKKNCPNGFYYDFYSISCRACSYGCAFCIRFDECSKCIPGLKLHFKPKHKIHKISEKDIKKCHHGCQFGSYLAAFDGECSECTEKCLECQDSLFILKEAYKRETDSPSYCTKCDEFDSKGSLLYIDFKTGKCIDSCKGSNKYFKDVNGRGFGMALYCYSCHKRCQKCSPPLLDQCLECKAGFILTEDKKCLSRMETIEFKQYFAFSVGAVVVIFFIFLTFIIKWLYQSSDEDSSTQPKKKPNKKALELNQKRIGHFEVDRADLEIQNLGKQRENWEVSFNSIFLALIF